MPDLYYTKVCDARQTVNRILTFMIYARDGPGEKEQGVRVCATESGHKNTQ